MVDLWPGAIWNQPRLINVILKRKIYVLSISLHTKVNRTKIGETEGDFPAKNIDS